MNEMINIYMSVVILNKGLTCLPLRSLFNPASTTSCGVFYISKRIWILATYSKQMKAVF